MKTFLRLFLGLVLSIIGSIIAYWIIGEQFIERDIVGFEEVSSDVSWKTVTTGLVTLIGVLAHSVYNRLSEKEGDVNIKEELFKTFRSSSFLRAVIVSPIVFIGVYGAIKNEPDLLVAHLFAFQNGFFWDVVFMKSKADLDEK